MGKNIIKQLVWNGRITGILPYLAISITSIIIILYLLISCQLHPYKYYINDERFKTIKESEDNYYAQIHGVSIMLHAYTTNPLGMKIILSMKNDNYSLITYKLNQFSLFNFTDKKEIASIYVNGHEKNIDFECKISKNEDLQFLFTTWDDYQNGILENYRLELGDIIISDTGEKVSLGSIQLELINLTVK